MAPAGNNDEDVHEHFFMRLSIALISTLGLFTCAGTGAAIALPYPEVSRSFAENQLYCYMHTEEGASLDLRSLCGAGSSSAPSTLSRSASTTSTGSTSLPSDIGGERKTCANFQTQAEAQPYVDQFPDLDRNNDGVPCEDLPPR
jgi:hypothetical protein